MGALAWGHRITSRAPLTPHRLRSCKTYRLVGSCSSASQAITSASCINGFLSTLVVCTGSNRGVEIFDLATMQLARSIPGAHTRAVHTIVQPAASPFAPHAKDAYELFATGEWYHLHWQRAAQPGAWGMQPPSLPLGPACLPFMPLPPSRHGRPALRAWHWTFPIYPGCCQRCTRALTHIFHAARLLQLHPTTQSSCGTCGWSAVCAVSLATRMRRQVL